MSYIFSGSELSLIKIMFEGRDRPFYGFTKQMELKPIDKAVLERFIVDKFSEGGKSIDKDASEWISKFSEEIPYYVQHICYEGVI